MNRETDVIVVGSGAAGSWAAKALTENGLRVLLLEAGLTHTDDHTQSKVAANRTPAREGSNAGVAGTHIAGGSHDPTRQRTQSTCYAYNQDTSPLFVDDLDCPYETPAAKPFNWIRMRGVGGRMALWARVALRMSDRQFRGASVDGHGANWPIGYADLKSYYREIEAFAGVRGIAENFDEVPDGEFVPTTLAESARAFKSALQEKWPDRNLTALRHAPLRSQQGNQPSDRRSPIQTAIHGCGTVSSLLSRADSTGNLELRTGSIVSRVITNPAGTRATGVEFVDAHSHRRCEANAPVILLCASTIETTRILLNSTCAARPGGIGNSSGILGKFLTEHTCVSAMGRRRGLIASSGDFYIPNFRNRSEPDQKFVRGYGIQGYIVPGGDDTTWCMLGSFGEALPRAENRVTISTWLKDKWGIPAPRISCEFSENEIAMAQDQAEQLRLMMSQAGYDVVQVNGLSSPGASIHEVGTARMGIAPNSSVLNPNNQVWDVPNLFVTDGAAFPSVGFQNPTLTIMAITARACRFIGLEFRRGFFD